MDPLKWKGAIKMKVQTADKKKSHLVKSEKPSPVVLSHQNYLELFQTVFNCKHFSPDSDETTLLLEKAIWIEDLYFSQPRSNSLKLKTHYVSCKHTAFNSCYCHWSHVHYMSITVMLYQLFGLPFWRHPFTAEDPLVTSPYDVMLN